MNSSIVPLLPKEEKKKKEEGKGRRRRGERREGSCEGKGEGVTRQGGRKLIVCQQRNSMISHSLRGKKRLLLENELCPCVR